MPNKKFLLLATLAFFGFPLHAQQRSRQQAAKPVHRWSMNIGYLINNVPFREFSVFTAENQWFAQGYRPWLGGQAGMGIGGGLSYSVIFPSRGFFRTHIGVESTGWVFGLWDIGGGLRVPFKKDIALSIEGYFSIGITGGSLALLTDHSIRKNLVVGYFGLKFRTAVEFPLPQKWFASLYLSYAAYPWHVANQSQLHVNGSALNAVIDSLQIGLEFGQRF